MAIDGEWGSVCNKYFDVNDAKVFCKAMVNVLDFICVILYDLLISLAKCIIY